MATTTPQPEPMAADQAATLADFARTAKAATRAVSLYPATHPAIKAALGKIVQTASRLAGPGGTTLVIYPDNIVIDGKSATRPDAAIVELAELLHDRLVGNLKMDAEADATDWHMLLKLLSRSPEDVMSEGGLAKAWTLSGRGHFEIQEIDYAEVLRERAGGELAAWDRIIAHCLQGDSVDLDERTLAPLLELAGNPERLGDFLARLQGESSDAKVGARAAALLRIIRGLVRALSDRQPGEANSLLQSMAAATSRLTPEMMMALLSQAQSGGQSGERDAAAQLVSRIGEGTIATFVAGNVVAERGATARLAQAFEALVPEAERRVPVLEAAREEAAESPLGGESGFEDLWQNASKMLLSYSDKPYVSEEYARELTESRGQAIEVERVSDDPPERVQAWLATISETAVRQLDLQLLLDLMTLEQDPEQWRLLSGIVVSEIERHTLLGDAPGATRLLDNVIRETGPDGRTGFKPSAAAAIERLAAGPLVRHVILHFRTVEDADVEPFAQLCRVLGTIVIRPLAEGIATEQNNRALGRLRDVLLGFGAAGRQSVEQLKNSANPAVRRTAIELLRVFGGREALPELASMLDDADPQVQREAIRAIVQIGTEEAYAVLENALVRGEAKSRETILQQLIALRDDKAVPLLCYVLTHTSPRGRLVAVHLGIVDALGGLSSQANSVRTLRTVLDRGEWWAPIRTASLRTAAATALRRLGSPEAIAALEEAATRGNRNVRKIARSQAALVRPSRERAKS